MHTIAHRCGRDPLSSRSSHTAARLERDAHRTLEVSARARDPDSNEDAARPTREVALRPTREPSAPFVPGPTAPRIAPAPRVIGPRATPARRPRPEDRPEAPAPAPLRTTIPVQRFLIASFSRARAANAVLALRARGFMVTPMLRAAAGPAGLSRELSSAVRRATIAATSLGALGALIGALIVPSEALIPTLGWIPGPAVGAALLAGVLGAIGFAVGLLAVLVTPPRALGAIVAGDQAIVAVHAAESIDVIAAAVVEQGGTVVAH